MNQLVIIGSGGFARELAWLWQDCKAAGQTVPELIGFISDDQAVDHWNGIPRLGNDSWAADNLSRDTQYLLGIGNAALRRKLGAYYDSAGYKAATLIHPSTRIGPNTVIGPGTIICAGNSLTVDIVLGKHVLCNLHCTIGHDSEIGDFSILSPGVHLSGNTTVGQTVEMGTGSMTIPGVTIADEITIGAGAVVNKDLTEKGTYAGVPARKIR